MKCIGKDMAVVWVLVLQATSKNKVESCLLAVQYHFPQDHILGIAPTECALISLLPNQAFQLEYVSFTRSFDKNWCEVAFDKTPKFTTCVGHGEWACEWM